jgi:hypothetical protein
MRDRVAVALLLAVIAGLAGCGGSAGNPTVPVQGLNVGEGISLADCTDWEKADTQQRLGTIRDLRNFAGGAVVGANGSQPSGTGAVLDDSKAYDLLDNYCKNTFARGFKLYKLYERAAGFAGAPAQ